MARTQALPLKRQRQVDAMRPPEPRQGELFPAGSQPSQGKTNGQIVDELGRLKAEKAELEEREKGLREQLLADGKTTECEGELFRATITRGVVMLTDWKKVCEKLEPSHQLISAHTSSQPRTTVKIVARRGVQV